MPIGNDDKYKVFNIFNVMKQCEDAQTVNKSLQNYKTNEGQFHRVRINYNAMEDIFSLTINDVWWGFYDEKGDIWDSLYPALV